MTSHPPTVYITKKGATDLFKGIKNKRYSAWIKMGKTRYLPICEVMGIEVVGKKKYINDIAHNGKYEITDIEYATMDNVNYFLHVKVIDGTRNGEIFIPIVG